MSLGRISGLIPMKPIAQEWTAKYVNTLLPSQSTYILQVTLYRQQWNPTKHDWDPETSDLMKPGQQPVQPLPAYPQANVAQENDYLGSIQTMAGAITNPMFYHVNKGDPWPWPAKVPPAKTDAPAAPAVPTGPGARLNPPSPPALSCRPPSPPTSPSSFTTSPSSQIRLIATASDTASTTPRSASLPLLSPPTPPPNSPSTKSRATGLRKST